MLGSSSIAEFPIATFILEGVVVADGTSSVSSSLGLSIEYLLSISSIGNFTTKSAGTAVDDATVGSLTWTTPENIVSSNNLYATSSGGATTHYLKATNFNLGIPSDVVIKGIKVEFERSTDGAVIDASIRIVKGGNIGSTEMALGPPWSSSDTYDVVGGSSDLWGETWTAADINASNFGVVLSAAIFAGTASVDHIRITVYYSSPSINMSLESLLQIPRNVNVLAEYTSLFGSANISPLEYLSNIYGNTSQPVDILGGLGIGGLTPLEYLTALNYNSNSPIEYTADNQAIVVLKNLPIEYLLNIYRETSLSVEMLGQVVKSGQNPLEYLASLYSNTNLPVEYIRNLAIAGQTPLEILGGLSRFGTLPVDILSIINLATNIPISYAVGTSNSSSLPIEYLLSLYGYSGLPVEYTSDNQAIVVLKNLPVEFLSFIGGNRSLNLDYLAGLRTNQNVAVDNLLNLSGNLNSPLDYLLTTSSVKNVPTDYLAGFNSNRASPIESLGRIGLNGVLNVEWIGRVGVSCATALEYLQSVGITKSTLVEALSGLSGTYIIPVEYLGTEAYVSEGKICGWVLENRGTLWVLPYRGTSWVPLGDSGRIWTLPEREIVWVSNGRSTTWNLKCRCDC